MIRSSAEFQGWRVKTSYAIPKEEIRPMNRGESVLLDFGQHLVGQLSFRAETAGIVDFPLRLMFTFGETAREIAEADHAMRPEQLLSGNWFQEDMITLEDWPATVTLPCRYAFRYVKIRVIETSPACAPVIFTNVRCRAVTSASFNFPPPPAPLPPDLRAIDTVSLRTLRDCMQTVFEDGPKRDRRLWLGDLRLQALTNSVSFKNLALVRRCLLQFAALARPDGSLPACVFDHPRPHIGTEFILDYSLLFGAILLDYLEAGGEQKHVAPLWPLAIRQIELALQHVGSDGLIHAPKNVWVFFDWRPGLDTQAALQGCLLYSMRQVLCLADQLGESHSIRNWPKQMATLTQSARAAWLSKDGLLRNGPERQLSWASQIWGVLGCILTPTEGAKALRRIMRQPSAIRPAGPYLYHHAVAAMLECDMRDEALSLIREYWGGMIRAGADTFWEIYDPRNPDLSPYNNPLLNSYCHAWSCTPAWFLRRMFAGKKQHTRRAHAPMARTCCIRSSATG